MLAMPVYGTKTGGGFKAVETTHGGRDADTAALVTTQTHVDGTTAHEGDRSGTAAAGIVAACPGVVHGTCGSGTADRAAGQVLTDGLASNSASILEYAGHDRSVHRRCPPTEAVRAHQTGNTGHGNIVFEADRLYLQQGRRWTGMLTVAAPGPGVERAVLRVRAVDIVTWCCFQVGCRLVVVEGSHRLERGVGFLEELRVGGQFRRGDVKADLAGDAQHVVSRDGHVDGGVSCEKVM